MSNKKNLVMFFDLIGRTIIGEKTDESNDTLGVKNPVVVNIVTQQQEVITPDGQKQMVSRAALQLLPLFFKEFLAAPDEGVEFVYNKKNITLTKIPVVFDFKLEIQYEQMTSGRNAAQGAPAPQPQPPVAKPDNKIINLFDE